MAEKGLIDLNIIKYYWGVVYRRRYIAMAIALIVLSLFTWGSFFMSKTYEASATVFIERSSLMSPLLQGVGVTISMEERLRNLRNILTSRNLIERVVKKLHLDAKVTNPAQYESLIAGMRKRVEVSVKSGGDHATDLLFKIAYRGSDPKKITEMVTTHVEECIAISDSSRASDVAGAFEFIQKEMEAYKTKLAVADKGIRRFREEHPQMVPQTENALLSRIENYQNGQIDAEIKLRELSKRRESLKKQLSGEKELTTAFVTRDGSPQARLNYLNNQLMMLLTKYTDSYPEVIKVKNEIDELQKQVSEASDPLKEDGSGSARSETAAMNPVYQQLKEELAKADIEIETLRARQDEFERQQKKGQTILRSMPREQEEWTRLQRDRGVYQRIYDDLLNKLESARVSRDLELGDSNTTFRVVDPAVEPQLPISPNRVKMILLGIIMGIVSGVGAIVAFDYLNPTFKSEDQFETDLKVPFLVAIPEIFTEHDLATAAILDKKIYKAVAIYLGIIGIVFVQQFLYQYMGISFFGKT